MRHVVDRDGEVHDIAEEDHFVASSYLGEEGEGLKVLIRRNVVSFGERDQGFDEIGDHRLVFLCRLLHRPPERSADKSHLDLSLWTSVRG